ncbi:MAG: hypothetical protein PHY40_04015 [Patescibacteria group bacterium]|nr:hypothetical protein [Patescibacteria group bacterium]
MSIKNPFSKPSEKKEPIKGEGFSMRDGNPFSKPVGPGLEFRPGETNETASERQKKEKAEREKLRQEYREKEANITPEEKAQRAEEWAQQDRKLMAEWFEDCIKKNGEYSEALQIKQDGSLDCEKRLDGRLPILVSVCDLKSPEDLYQLMHKISQEYPNLDISFEVDPSRKWIKYRVAKKVESSK